jgi:hypothetical protein
VLFVLMLNAYEPKYEDIVTACVKWMRCVAQWLLVSSPD